MPGKYACDCHHSRYVLIFVSLFQKVTAGMSHSAGEGVSFPVPDACSRAIDVAQGSFNLIFVVLAMCFGFLLCIVHFYILALFS